MAYNKELATRIRKTLSDVHHVVEKKMFGGLTFMVNDKMCVGVVHDDLMCRIDPEIHEQAIKKKAARTMDMMKGRKPKGFVFVGKEGIDADKDFTYWIDLALEFNKKAKITKK